MKKLFFILMICMFSIIIIPCYAKVEGTNRTIKLNTNIIDELETYDEMDYFNFKLSKPGSIKIDFDFDINGRYIVKLVNVTNNKVVQNLTFDSQVNTTTGRYSKSGNKIRVDDGKYQITVSTSSYHHSDEEYKLIVNYDSETGNNYEKEDNDTAKTSMIIDPNRRIIGNLDSSSDVDYYMVELDDNGSIQLRMEYDKSTEYSVTLYSETNAQLNQIMTIRFSNGNVAMQDKLIDISDRIRVPEGNYYIKISNGSWSKYTDSDYAFTISYINERYRGIEKESNDTVEMATIIYEGQETIANLNSSRDIDYFCFNPWGEKYYLDMKIPDGSEYNVLVYKEENGRLTQVSSNRVDDSKYIEINNAQGSFYIKVTSRKYSNEDYFISLINAKNLREHKTIILEENKEYMIVNGNIVNIDGDRGTKPIIINGRMLLPIRAIIENLDGKINWEVSTGVTEFVLGDRTVVMPSNSSVAYVNGQVKYLDVPTATINGRTMVPVRFLIENLGGEVIWQDGIVTIKY